MLFSKSALASVIAIANAYVQAPIGETATASPDFNINSTVKLNSGHYIPLLGFGVWQTPFDAAEEVVLEAVKAGYRHVDSAIAYRNEEPSAAGLVDSEIARSDLFFTSKIPEARFGYESAKAAIKESLEKIGKLEYIDLYLIHWPGKNVTARHETWKAMAEAVEAGKIKSIGVSNFEVEHLEDLASFQAALEKAGLPAGVLSVNQMELHPWSTYKATVAWCKARGVVLEAYSPLTRGEHFNDLVLAPIIKRTGKSAAQILIRWSLQKDFVPLPKTVTKSRIYENADVYDFEINTAEMLALDAVGLPHYAETNEL